MNISTIIMLTIVLAVVYFATKYIIKGKGCDSGCSACIHKNACHEKSNINKNTKL